MNMQIQQAMDSLSSFQDDSIVFALLIGSMATGDSGPLSDMDIAIYFDSSLKRNEILNLALKVGAKLEKDLKAENIDIIVLNTANPSMKFSAIKYGIPLLVRDEGVYEDFVIRALSEYYDNQHFLRRQYENAKKAIGEVALR